MALLAENKLVREIPVCSSCGEKAVYTREYSGEKLCKSCFLSKFEKRVLKTITRYKMFRHDDQVAVAVSGGKDSLVLLHVLTKIERQFPETSLVAITIDEGIPGYRNEAVEHAETEARRMGVEINVLTFEELFGRRLDEMLGALSENGTKLQPCTICGILRRRAINVAAKRLNATVVATAHTLDDIVQTYFMNVLRGDLNREIGQRNDSTAIVPRVAPLRVTPEREAVFYAYLKKIPFQSYICPNASKSARNKIREFLDSYEADYPGSLYTALSAFESIVFQKDRPEKLCRQCGEFTSRDICRVCEILSSFQTNS